jgi:peptidoglycan/LPS O-acetylase OafA/YrhL
VVTVATPTTRRSSTALIGSLDSLACRNIARTGPGGFCGPGCAKTNSVRAACTTAMHLRSRGRQVTTVLARYQKTSRRRRRRAGKLGQRLDIQGLRMVAVLTVFANHLWNWPGGGFVGVDVFFVISGFLITGNLLRSAERTGTVSFKKFYWNRVRRIVPAATVVLLLTYAASVWVFLPFRSHQVGVDALFAFFFWANWRFAVEGTDYFAASDSVSPLQHFWSLSIEEQFYFVWPAIIFVVSLIVLRRAWTHEHRMRFTGGVMTVIVVASLGWALYETATSPTWAYFNTFARVWELGVGALLATAVGLLARIPGSIKPFLSWTGIALIVASLFLLADTSVGFPAPWALLPVSGTAIVIAAGVGGEPKYQGLLRNPVSVYIGNVSYSLYLVHWPVIVILGAMMDSGANFYITVVALAFGLSIASYHFVENPLRHAGFETIREAAHEIRRRRYRPERVSGYAALGALSLLMVGLISYADRRFVPSAPPPTIAVAASTADPSTSGPQVGPLATALQGEIVDALKATEWPKLDPSMESVISKPPVDPETQNCGGELFPDAQACTWGSPSARVRVVVVGDSVGAGYAGPLRDIALNSGGQIQVHTEAMFGCTFANDLIESRDESLVDACVGRKEHAVDVINTTKPDVVVISNSYGPKRIVGEDRYLTTDEWSESLRQIVEKFKGNTGKLVFLAPPPADKQISDCYGRRGSQPADCISGVTQQWLTEALPEQNLAAALGGTWIDSRPWFCSGGRLCPSFVGSTPTKVDSVHMTPSYGQKIFPVMGESFREAGVF